MPSIAPRPKIGQAPELTLGPSIDPTRLAMKVSTMSPVQTVNHVPGSNHRVAQALLPVCFWLTRTKKRLTLLVTLWMDALRPAEGDEW